MKPSCIIVTLTVLSLSLPAPAQTTAFTYQGFLTENGGPANSASDFEFRLYDAAIAGVQQGGTVTVADISVTNGLFTVLLDFGAAPFSGADRWLDIALRPGASAGAYTNLVPRHPITPTPYAINAANLMSVFNSPLDIKVNGARALRFEPTATSPNLIGGYSGNSVAPGMDAAVITGGGRAGAANTAGAELTFIGGGWANTNNGGGAFLGGGFYNRIEASAYDSVLTGGRENVIQSNLGNATLSGGFKNVISNGANFATISGGQFNQAGAIEATVAGGGYNRALGFSSAIGGGGANAAQSPWSGIASGRDNVVRPASDYSLIGGGRLNFTDSNSAYSVIGGGRANSISTDAASTVIAGGWGNSVAFYSSNSVVVGGYLNTIDYAANSSVIGGGWGNTIEDNSTKSFIGGGEENRIQSLGSWNTIGGGLQNSIRSGSDYSVIAGGYSNVVEVGGDYLLIGGGAENTIGSNALFSSIGGGWLNSIQSGAQYAMIPGGLQNIAGGNYSFAAGRLANAVHHGTFVWADSTSAGFNSTTSNQFSVRAGGGARFETGGAGLSVDGQSVLNALSALNASQLTSGTVPDARLSANVALRNTSNDFFLGPQTLYAGTASRRALEVRGAAGQFANLQEWQNSAGAVLASVSPTGTFIGNGAGLTSLDAGQLSTGTVGDGRLSANVALRGTTQSFTGNNFFLGSVTIGTNVSSAPLTVRSTNTFYGIEHTDGTRRLSTYLDSSGGWLGTVSSHPLNFFVANGSAAMMIDLANQVGIGRTPTANKLEVEGNASKTTAGSWLANSDARIKTDIAPVTGALDALARVRLVTFRYTDDYRAQHPSVDDRRYLNVVAQEFREVFPEHVKSSGEKLPDGSEILQVDTYPLTIYSAAAVQELNRKLNHKDTEIAELKERLGALEKLVNRLSAAENAIQPQN